MLGALLQQMPGDEEQALDGSLCLVGQRGVFLAEVHQVERARLAHHQQVTAQPGLQLTGTGALLEVLRVEFFMPRGEFIEVFGNRR